MPKGPQGQKRPADVIGNAVLIARIATGDASDSAVVRKDPHAVALGKRGGAKGGKARAAKLSPDERSKIASRAAASRWKRK